MHGGGWKRGHAADPAHDGAVPAGDSVVVVTFNYRWASRGSAWRPAHPPIGGFLDRAAALAWVHDNIAGFGGDTRTTSRCSASPAAARPSRRC
ncbi:carboxylesterase family protein [Streptodolium elevatio]